MKKIAIIVGSESDLKQCLYGLKFLAEKSENTVMICVRSQHRNTLSLQELLRDLPKYYDVAIVGAGWANHLTGCVDAFLRYELKTMKVPIIGVAFKDELNNRHTEAAILSMTEVPGTQVTYRDENGIFVGQGGFLRACKLAMSGNLPMVKLFEQKPVQDLSLEEAIQIASK
jgi:phosphoribosylcarboxyaminoimidazole (NCAIR) mutase